MTTSLSLDQLCISSNHSTNAGANVTSTGLPWGPLESATRKSCNEGEIIMGCRLLSEAVKIVRNNRVFLQAADFEVIDSDLKKAQAEGDALMRKIQEGADLVSPWAHERVIRFQRRAQTFKGTALCISMQAEYEMHRDGLPENKSVPVGVNKPIEAQPRTADTKQAAHRKSVSPCDPGIPTDNTLTISKHICDEQTTPTSNNSSQAPLPCVPANTATPLDYRLSRLMVTLNDHDVFRRRGEEAQILLNDIQEVLDQPLESQVRWRLVCALIKLSRRSGLYPERLVRTDIRRTSEEPVAGGRFGDVWKGLMEGDEVAVKVLRIYVNSDLEELMKKFSREAVTWCQLSHPNILPFRGIYHLNNERTRVCLISPWMSNGNVREFLIDFPETHRINLAFDVACGLEYLHKMEPCIVHGDLKGLNVLVMSDHRACLADFGLAIVRNSSVTTFSMSSERSHRSHGTLRWMAPELLVLALDNGGGRGKCPATDVYAFACVCYEIFTGNFPFHDIRMENSVIEAVSKGKRPPRPPPELCRTRGLNEKMWSVIDACWTMSPTKRPTASRIVKALRLLGAYPSWRRRCDKRDRWFNTSFTDIYGYYSSNVSSVPA